MVTLKFQQGRRYRITVLPAGARTRTVTHEVNYLGTDHVGHHVFDGRPKFGTSTIPEDAIRGAEDIGPAVYGRA